MMGDGVRGQGNLAVVLFGSVSGTCDFRVVYKVFADPSNRLYMEGLASENPGLAGGWGC